MHPQKITRRSTIHRTAIVDFKIISDYHSEKKLTNWQRQFLYIHRTQSTKFTLQQAMKAQSGVGAQHPAPAALPPGKRSGTHYTGGSVGPRVGRKRRGKSRPPPGFDPQTVQPVASRYTDWTIPAHKQSTITNTDNQISVLS